MKEWLYRLLVSRTPQIKERYLNRRNSGTGRLSGLAYLVWLNLRYGLIPGRRQDMFLPDTALRLPGERSESSRSAREAPEQFARRLAEFDIVSFDVFDTLLFRPFSDPRDMFGLIGLELNYPGFQKLRIQAEEQARRKEWESGETREVTLGDIWEIMERETGIPRQKGMDAESYIKEAKDTIRSYLKVEAKEIVFTSGGTESNNMALLGAAYANRRRGNHIITTSIEHASVYNPLIHLEEEGFRVTYLPVDEKGIVDIDALKNAFCEDTILVSIMSVNNEVGSINDLKALSKIVKTYSHAFFPKANKTE